MQSQYDQSEILTYDIEEGTFTVNTETLTVPLGASVITGTFATQVNKENFLEQGTGENALKRAAAGSNATHFNPYKPEVNNALPDETTIQANLDLRYVGAVKLKPGEWFFPVVASNAAIAVGDYLEVATDGSGVQKKASSTSTLKSLEIVALNASSATDRVYVRCLLDGSTIPVASA